MYVCYAFCCNGFMNNLIRCSVCMQPYLYYAMYYSTCLLCISLQCLHEHDVVRVVMWVIEASCTVWCQLSICNHSTNVACCKKRRQTPVHVATGETTTCASGVFVPAIPPCTTMVMSQPHTPPLTSKNIH